MRMAIVGCGWTGAILAYKLSSMGYSIDVYEQNKQVKTVCACGIPSSFFYTLAKTCLLNPEDYLLWKAHKLIIDLGSFSVHVPVDLCTFDKQKFMHDLVEQSTATFHFKTKYHNNPTHSLIIDATGTRSLLGRLPSDSYYMTYQVKAKFTPTLPYGDFYMKMDKKHGCKYLWMFPLTEKEAYVGYASTNSKLAVEKVEHFLRKHNAEPIEKQAKLLRLNPPHESLPFAKGKIVGVGNSIGAVSSLGEGNAPSAITAFLLIQNLENPTRYTKQVLETLSWLKNDHAAYRLWQKNSVKTLAYMLKIHRIYVHRFNIPLLKCKASLNRE